MITLYHFDRDKLTRDEIYEVSLGSLRGGEATEGLHARLMAEGKYVAMAEFEGDDLNRAYAVTQNGVVSDSWTLAPPPGLTPLVGGIEYEGKLYGHRSSMMGDILVLDGEMHLVDTLGFTELGPMPGNAPKP